MAANLGKTFALWAAGVHVVGQLAMMGFYLYKKSAFDDAYTIKYPDNDARRIAMGNFGRSTSASPSPPPGVSSIIDCVPGCGTSAAPAACVSGCTDSSGLIRAELQKRHIMAHAATIEGLVQSAACLLAIMALLSLKSHMALEKRAGVSDEKELIAFSCLLLGLFLPMLQFSMMTGTMQYIAHIGQDAQVATPSGDMDFTGFGHSDWQMLYMQLKIEEARFEWCVAGLLLTMSGCRV